MSSVRSFLNVVDDDDDWSSLLSTVFCGDIPLPNPLPIPLPDPFPEADFPFPLPLTNPKY